MTKAKQQETAPNSQGHASRINQLEPQLLFGRGPGEKLLSEKMPPDAPFPTQAGRGGSVSRRDHNPAAGNRAQLAGARKQAESSNSNPSCSSGGGPGEKLLSEKMPPDAPFPTQAGRGGSVSRRDHNPAAGNRAQLAGARK